VLPTGGYAQYQKVKELLNQHWQEVTDPQEAVYFRTVMKDSSGVRHGQVISYYAEDKPRMVGNIKQNNFFGPFLYYYPNGQVESKGNYSGGDRIGLWEEWYPTGKPRKVGNYLPDEPTKPYRYRDTYRITSFWDSTGTQLVTAGTGRFYATDEKGKLLEEGAYAAGAKEGKWLDYYENGKVKHEEIYQAAELVRGTYFNESGEPSTYNAYDYEAMPEYPGGLPALSTFLRAQLKYPKEAKRRNISGTVFVGFIVDNTGRVKDIKLLKGIGFGCDEEALRVVSAMPPWNPGRQRGQPVSVSYALPIRFIIQ
jgi:TonB family protein